MMIAKNQPSGRLRHLKRVAVAAGITLALGACSSTMTKQEQGTVAGAVVGALVGHAIDGKRGAAVGAAVGGVAGNLVGRQLDRQETALRSELSRQIDEGSVSLARTAGDNAMVLSLRGNVLFDSGSATVRPAGYDELNRIARAWHDNRGVNIVITGHTDNVGPLEFNRDLSAQRAENVALYLLKRNVPYSNLYTRGAGELAPTTGNDTAAGRSQNRRVDLVFYAASEPPPEVRLVYTRNTEPNQRSYLPTSPAQLHEHPEAAYAFSQNERSVAQRRQQQVRETEAIEPLSPIRSASELINRV